MLRMQWNFQALIWKFVAFCGILVREAGIMAVYFKNSYKSDGAVLPLSVKNVGFQQCTPGYRWGAGVRDHYLIHYVVSGRGTFTAGLPRARG